MKQQEQKPKAIRMTKELIDSINFMISGAMNFHGFPNIAEHRRVIAKAIEEAQEIEDKKEDSKTEEMDFEPSDFKSR